MLTIAVSLGDDGVNVVPDLPGANSAYQLVFHSCGMLEWWTRESILGQPVGRDRAAEFAATGTVAELQARVDAVASQLAEDLPQIDLDAPLRGPSGDYGGTAIAASARGALLHVLEELAQHHGHLEITRDVVMAGRRARPA